jgi:NCS1 family nucleobase:cation symporter-1
VSPGDAELRDPRLWNEDLAPTRPEQRTWGVWHVAALWVGMAVCIPTYMMAGDLTAAGMSVAQAIFVVALGNVVVLLPMLLNAHPGTRYGIPFPVLARASFGWRGANIPAVARALVACGWFGIQTWIGGSSIHVILLKLGVSAGAPLAGIGISGLELLCFFIFWSINVFFIWKGVESIKWLETLAAPFLLLGGTALLVYVWWKHGTGTLTSKPGLSGPAFWKVFGPGLTGMVSFWSTLALNIPDFSRYCKNQRTQLLGQTIALPPTMAYFAFIGAAVAAATGLGDPNQLIASFSSPVVVALGLLGLTIATLSTNIAANVVSPSNDFSNLAPARISYRMGGYITAALGVVIMPWKLMNNYVFGWLNGYGALLGPVGGIMIADYWIVRRQRLVVADLYRKQGRYAYAEGVNPRAIIALVVGIAPNIPGFLSKVVGVAGIPDLFVQLYAYTWFIGFGLAAFTYVMLMRHERAATQAEDIP